MELAELYAAQKALDKEIQERHHVTYESTLHERMLALLVELGEFANETRTFKFWSLKGPSPKERILDEYADALHFFLSLGIAVGIDHFAHDFVPYQGKLTDQILGVYQEVVVFTKTGDVMDYEKAFHAFLNLLPSLGYNEEDMFAAYRAKLAVNYERQETHY